uniref:Uncharacterized protein n=1 Tax=Amphimedon queenslandica TaxID=400682 RepID=A0A1X7VUP5_AMPQE
EEANISIFIEKSSRLPYGVFSAILRFPCHQCNIANNNKNSLLAKITMIEYTTINS